MPRVIWGTWGPSKEPGFPVEAELFPGSKALPSLLKLQQHKQVGVDSPSNCIFLGKGPDFGKHHHPGQRLSMCLPVSVHLIAIPENMVFNHHPRCFF